FGIRLRDEFRQDRGADLVNSDGLRGTENIWGEAAKWVDYATMIDGARYGVAIHDDPKNLRHPTTWHARGYGLCSANPFATRSFTGNTEADGSYTIAAGERLTLNYTVVIYEGERPTRDRPYTRDLNIFG
ncbi:MAG: hypothetical protein GY953_41185, partial [bacterium]|nr:hypothetical protein [bacterium]